MDKRTTSQAPASTPAAARQLGDDSPSASSWIAPPPDQRTDDDAFNPASLPNANVAQLRNLLTIEEVADYYRRSTRTIRRRVKAGRLPAVREGRTILFRPEDIIELTAASIRRGLEQRYRLDQPQSAQPTEAQSPCK